MEYIDGEKNPMGLLVLTCACSGADGLARKYMKQAGYEGWITHPIYEGKQKCNSLLEGMRRQGYDTRFLQQWIASNSSFVVFVGYGDTNEKLVWRNAYSGSVESRIDAEALIKAFA